MINRVALLFLIFLNILVASENKVTYSKSNNLVISKTIDSDTKITVEQNYLFNSEKNITIQIVDKNNKNIESKNFKIDKSIKLIDITSLNSSDYFLVGYQKYTNREYDIVLIKYNPSIGMIWEKNYPQDGIEIPTKILIAEDNSIFIGGYCAMDKESYYAILTNDIQLMKINSDGSPLWVKTVGLKKVDEELLDFQITDDHEILLLGKRKYFKDILYLAKINKFGNIAWQNTYEIGNYVKNAQITHESSTTPIEVKANILDIDYNSKNFSSNDMTLFLDNDGKMLNTQTDITYEVESLYVNSNDSNDFLKGIITSNSVNIRQQPIINSTVITNLSKGDIVEIIEKTENKHRINDMNDYWYHLKINDEKSGWIYGYFIDLVK